jgi:hypothetical protein
MNRMSKLAVGVAVAGALLPAFASSASAAPVNAKSSFPVSIYCDNGQSYSAVVNGGGGDNSNSGQTYNPAHVVTNNTLLQPIAFGPSTFSLYINDELVEQDTQPGGSRGNGNAPMPKNATIVNCSYEFGSSQTDPTTGDVYTFVGDGTITAFIPAGQR